jgi:hypothetical protein
MRFVRRLPIVICFVYILLATIYSVVVPVYEPPDESYHFAFVQHLIRTGALPVQNPSIKQPWNQEGSQAPLYYVTASLLARFVPGADEPYLLGPNPHAIVGVRDARTNHNLWTHTRAEEYPWRGPVLAMHLIRLLGVIFGAWTVYAVYRTARLAAPDMLALAPMAMAFTAFNAMFLVQSISINNDSLVAALGATASWLSLRVLRCGFTWRRMAALAVVAALAALSKVSGLSVVVIAGALIAILAAKRRITIRQAALAIALLVGAFVMLAGWWYVRNLQLYGDLTGLRTLSQIVGTRGSAFSVNALFDEMTLLRVSTWGLYGWLNVFIGPSWLPAWMDILTVVALVGGVWWLIQLRRSRQWELILPVGLLGLHFLVIALSIVQYTWLTPASLGRLLIPAMASLSVLACLGWQSAARAIGKPKAMIVPIATLAFTTTLAPILTLGPAYGRPPTVSAMPASASPLDVWFDKIRIVGYHIDRQPVVPGGRLPVTVYYQGEPDERNLSLYLTVLGRSARAIGKVDSYPGGGNLPTSTWNPSLLYADTYFVPIANDAVGPAEFKVEVGWWDFATGERIKPKSADGTAISALVLRGGTLLSAGPAPQPGMAERAVFSGTLRLDEYTLLPADGVVNPDGRLDLTLVWEGLTPIYEDFTVFVHLQTEGGTLVAQDDSPPLRGEYPTSAWATGHPFADSHTIQLASVPPGTYRLVIGLYRLADGSRLPVDTGGDSVTLQTPIIVTDK